ncbi:MAG: hypothetical protein ACREOI_18550 [bacterium]
MKNDAYISVQVNRQKAEKVRKIYKAATAQEAVEQILDIVVSGEKKERRPNKSRGKPGSRKGSK